MDTRAQENRDTTEQEFRTYLYAQLDEIMKHKWYLGEVMQRDPLECMSMDEICLQWIEKHARAFRLHWEARRRREMHDSQHGPEKES